MRVEYEEGSMFRNPAIRILKIVPENDFETMFLKQFSNREDLKVGWGGDLDPAFHITYRCKCLTSKAQPEGGGG